MRGNRSEDSSTALRSARNDKVGRLCSDSNNDHTLSGMAKRGTFGW